MKYKVKVSFELETEVNTESLDEAGNIAIKEFWENSNGELLNIQYWDEFDNELIDGDDT